MKEIIENYGWIRDKVRFKGTPTYYKNDIIGADLLYLRLYEDFLGGTCIKITEYKYHYDDLDEIEGESKADTIFKGWLLDNNKEEFNKIMKQLRIEK